MERISIFFIKCTVYRSNERGIFKCFDKSGLTSIYQSNNWIKSAQRVSLIFLLTFLILLLPFAKTLGQVYSVAETPWPEEYGNHRAVLDIPKGGDAVYIDLLWRRHDKDPGNKRFLVIEAKTGDTIPYIYRLEVNNERCKIVAGPVKNSGLYYFYYLPSTAVKGKSGARGYASIEAAPNKQWITTHKLDQGVSTNRHIDKATIKEIQSRTKFDSFYPMEVIATQAEEESFLSRYKSDYLVFTEDRTMPIRMLDALPLRWVQKPLDSEFIGNAKKNEYYALQLGIYASQLSLENIRLEYSDLKDKNGNIISKDAFTCYNTDGVDIDGKPFTLKVNVEQGKIQPMWVGIDIPHNAKPGTYEGTVTIKPEKLEEQNIKVILEIENELLADRGDSETWRHSRLRWLNSRLGIDNEPVAPYTPLRVENRKISCLGRSIQLNDLGLPEVINSWGNEILASPIKFVIQVNNQVETFELPEFSYKLKENGLISWESAAENDNFKLICNGKMEFDGHLNFTYEIKSKSNIQVQDIRLEIPMKKEFATYMVGMGRLGGFTPAHHISRWLRNEDSFWIGETTAGIHCELRGAPYNGPMINLYQSWSDQANLPAASWSNGGLGRQNIGHGGFRIDSDENTVTASAFSSLRRMTPDQTVKYEFALIITPVKEVDTKNHFSNRYFHATSPTPEVIANGGNVMNVHHANKFNPYINYPFIAQEEMRGLINEWHAKGWKVKIYYTVRELSNYLTEIWALRSLGHEILADGNGGGDRWLQEHLVNNYTPQWYAYLGNGVADEAILNSGESRWYNYYIEGLAWLLKHMDIDGIYLDDVSYDRRILKRMRKVMEAIKPGACMIDLHSNTSFSIGPVNQYLEFYPYIDRTWYGEGFSYDIHPADFWLVETSGIPFGVMNDILLQVGINERRGMLYGMTIRRGNAWKLWKLWDDFDIENSQMDGYWEKNPVVTTDHKDVYATTYIKEGSILIVLASWIKEPVSVKMNIDWKRLGLNPLEVNITAPEIQDYQKERSFKSGEAIPIDALGDCFIVISRK